MGAGAAAPRPTTIDQLIAIVQREFPTASIRITGRGRTIRRQAELMADSIRANRATFNSTYAPAPHITEMNQWVTAHPRATLQETVDEFEAIIRRARAAGAVVSNHLSDSARDISIPLQRQNEVEARLQQLGARVIREPNAAGGPHWHVDW